MTETKALEIESWEDRSGQPEPNDKSFGFVYFNDGSRVGYSHKTDAHDEVWEPRTNGGGKFVSVTKEHLDLARALLTEAGVLPR